MLESFCISHIVMVYFLKLNVGFFSGPRKGAQRKNVDHNFVCDVLILASQCFIGAVFILVRCFLAAIFARYTKMCATNVVVN